MTILGIFTVIFCIFIAIAALSGTDEKYKGGFAGGWAMVSNLWLCVRSGRGPLPLKLFRRRIASGVLFYPTVKSD